MKPKWTLSTKVLLLASIPIVLQVVLFIALTSLESRSMSKLSKLQHQVQINSDEVAAACDLIDICMAVDINRGAYLASQKFEARRSDGVDKLKHLQILLSDQPEGLDKVNQILGDYNKLKDAVDQAKDEFMSGGLEQTSPGKKFVQLQDKFETTVAAATNWVAVSDQTMRPETLTMHDLKQFDQRYKLILQYGLLIEMLIIGGCLLWLNRDLASRFKVMTDNAYRLASRRPLYPHVGGTDEVSQIDAAFHVLEGKLSEFERNEQVIAENTRAVICAINDKLAFVNINAASSKLFGYDPEELLSMKVARLLLADDVPNPVALFDQIKEGTSPMFESHCLHKNGQLIETEWTVRWSKSENLFFCTVHDISDRKQAERVRREIIGMVSSDLERPLSHITRALQTLRSPSYAKLSEKGALLLSRALSAASQMTTLVKDLIDIDQMESGNIELHRSTHSARQLVEQSIDMVGGLSSSYSVTVAARGDDCDIFVDEDRFKQILVNLISNAIKFSSPGSTVFVETVDTPEWAEFKVSDSGIGIPQDLLPVIFERFRQVRASDSKEKGGSGLGLAICKTLVELHHGKIKVASAVNLGTTFTVCLPKHPQTMRGEMK